MFVPTLAASSQIAVRLAVHPKLLFFSAAVAAAVFVGFVVVSF